MIKIKAGVEAMGGTREDTIELNMTLEEWNNLTEDERNSIVEDWAYEQVQMGTWYEVVE